MLKPVTFAVLLASAAGSAEAWLTCNGEEVDGRHFYCDPAPAAEPEPEPDAQEEPEELKTLTATEEIEAFREYADELKHRAILDPTPENVQAYMEVNKQMAQQAARFAAVWQRVLFGAPHLDANVRRPRTQMGTNIYRISAIPWSRLPYGGRRRRRG